MKFSIGSFAIVFGLALSSCSSSDSQAGANEFPRLGKYSEKFKSPSQEVEGSDMRIDASTQSKLEDFLFDTMQLGQCKDRNIKIEQGKFIGHTMCNVNDSEIKVEISGSYSASSIDVIARGDMGSSGPRVVEKHFRLRDK